MNKRSTETQSETYDLFSRSERGPWGTYLRRAWEAHNDKKNQTGKNANTRSAVPDSKTVAIDMLRSLHAKLLNQGTAAIKTNPQKTAIITKAMDADLARVHYVSNVIRVKM